MPLGGAVFLDRHFQKIIEIIFISLKFIKKSLI